MTTTDEHCPMLPELLGLRTRRFSRVVVTSVQLIPKPLATDSLLRNAVVTTKLMPWLSPNGIQNNNWKQTPTTVLRFLRFESDKTCGKVEKEKKSYIN